MDLVKNQTVELAEKINSGPKSQEYATRYLLQRQLDSALFNCGGILRTPVYPNAEGFADGGAGAALLPPCPSSSYISTDTKTRQIQASPVVLLYEMINDGKETTSILRSHFGFSIGKGVHVRNAIRAAMSEAK